MKKATILGVPIDLGAENLGVDIGPDAFRYQKVKEKLQSSGFKISDKGNIVVIDRNNAKIGNPKLKYLDEILRISELSAKLVQEEISKGQKIIAFGGDHSITLGVLAGASVTLNNSLGLIYFDAHGDMNTESTTLTGNIHGMHLASLMGFGNKELVNVYKKGIKVKKENLVHIGGKDFDPAEIEFIKEQKLKCFTIFDFLSNGLVPLLELIKYLQTQVTHIWVSFDLDVIDSTYAPGAGMSNPGGLTYREVTSIAEYIGKNCNVIGVDMVEYNPLKDIDGKTAELGIELIAKLFGSNYSWYTKYLEDNKLR